MQGRQAKQMGAVTNLTIAGTANTSSAITAKRVRLCATVPCYVAFGSTADATCMVLAANVPEEFVFPDQQPQTVSVLQVSAGGVLSIMSV